jgi:hypothetical protein
MMILLLWATVLTIGYFALTRVASWVSTKRPLLYPRNIAAFCLSGVASYSVAFVLDMWMLAFTGAIPTDNGNVIWPSATWLIIAFICARSASLTKGSRYALCTPYFLFALLLVIDLFLPTFPVNASRGWYIANATVLCLIGALPIVRGRKLPRRGDPLVARSAIDTDGLRRQIEEAEDKVNREQTPLRAGLVDPVPIDGLGDAIRKASFGCARTLIPYCENGKDGVWEQCWAIREFIFFFTHLVGQMTRFRYGTEAHERLLAILDECNRFVYTENYFKCPDNKRQDAYTSFTADFRKADELYCDYERQESSTNDGANEIDPFLLLCCIVSDGLKLNKDKERVRRLVYESARSAFADMQPEKLTDDAIAAISSTEKGAPALVS